MGEGGMEGGGRRGGSEEALAGRASKLGRAYGAAEAEAADRDGLEGHEDDPHDEDDQEDVDEHPKKIGVRRSAARLGGGCRRRGREQGAMSSARRSLRLPGVALPEVFCVARH